MRIPPFYSLSPGIAVEDVWHDNDECEIGLHIHPEDRLSGTDHVLKHCMYCILLDQTPRTSQRAFTPGDNLKRGRR